MLRATPGNRTRVAESRGKELTPRAECSPYVCRVALARLRRSSAHGRRLRLRLGGGLLRSEQRLLRGDIVYGRGAFRPSGAADRNETQPERSWPRLV